MDGVFGLALWAGADPGWVKRFTLPPLVARVFFNRKDATLHA